MNMVPHRDTQFIYQCTNTNAAPQANLKEFAKVFSLSKLLVVSNEVVGSLV